MCPIFRGKPNRNTVRQTLSKPLRNKKNIFSFKLVYFY
ncbi:hypothetical protein Q7O_001198 [Pectobacterium carotovorum subsp. carotovorum PCCS1]|nr:hypothetical protein [Pectobacterium carotovorum subsp. carotovorum PCCS1]